MKRESRLLHIDKRLVGVASKLLFVGYLRVGDGEIDKLLCRSVASRQGEVVGFPLVGWVYREEKATVPTLRSYDFVVGRRRDVDEATLGLVGIQRIFALGIGRGKAVTIGNDYIFHGLAVRAFDRAFHYGSLCVPHRYGEKEIQEYDLFSHDVFRVLVFAVKVGQGCCNGVKKRQTFRFLSAFAYFCAR